MIKKIVTMLSDCLEHTKPLFNQHIILNLHNLYVYHTFINLFKIPISLHSLFNLSQRGTHFLLHLPGVTLEISKNNFVFQSSSIFNKLIINILQRNLPGENGIVFRGSSQNSDLCATLPFVKKKLKTILFNQQSLGNTIKWVAENSLKN